MAEYKKKNGKIVIIHNLRYCQNDRKHAGFFFCLRILIVSATAAHSGHSYQKWRGFFFLTIDIFFFLFNDIFAYFVCCCSSVRKINELCCKNVREKDSSIERSRISTIWGFLQIHWQFFKQKKTAGKKMYRLSNKKKRFKERIKYQSQMFHIDILVQNFFCYWKSLHFLFRFANSIIFSLPILSTSFLFSADFFNQNSQILLHSNRTFLCFCLSIQPNLTQIPGSINNK